LKDPNDASLYDLNLNVCRLSVADCARIIVTALDAIRKPALVASNA
jgi:hypothetical protein